MQIQTIGIDDLAACLDLTADVGWTTPPEIWLLLLRSGKTYGFFDGGALGGTVLAFPHDGYMFVGMMLVRPRLQRRGYARQLLEHAISEAHGMPAALLATEFGAPLYRTLDFTEQGSVVSHSGHWNGPPINGVRVVTPQALSDDDRSKMLSADATVFGRPRTVLLDALLGAATRVALTEDAAGAAYAISWQHGSETHIGPVIADDDGTAFTLVSALASEAAAECRIRVPRDRFNFRDQLRQHGLEPIGEVTFMTRGSRAVAQQIVVRHRAAVHGLGRTPAARSRLLGACPSSP
ncbi:MAG TPA: GNAT family N-acetyltransferase [Candidatus Baltobacteraceae bacterium]|nr:GNAT family N-acetyltransferase [Candidatus Baltobacteraceae bacterium]